MRQATSYEALRHTFQIVKEGRFFQIWDVESYSWVYHKVNGEFVPVGYSAFADTRAILTTCSLNAGYWVKD